MVDHFETSALDLLETERINYAFMVPTMMNAVVHDNTRGRDFAAMKCLLIAAAPIQDATAWPPAKYLAMCSIRATGRLKYYPCR